MRLECNQENFLRSSTSFSSLPPLFFFSFLLRSCQIESLRCGGRPKRVIKLAQRRGPNLRLRYAKYSRRWEPALPIFPNPPPFLFISRKLFRLASSRLVLSRLRTPLATRLAPSRARSLPSHPPFYVLDVFHPLLSLCIRFCSCRPAGKTCELAVHRASDYA